MLQRIRDVVAEHGGLRKAASRAFSRPSQALSFGLGLLNADWVQLVLDSDPRWNALRTELRLSGFLVDRQLALSRRFEELGATEVRGHAAVPGQMRSLHVEMLYALVRHRRPKVVVETGVCNGLSSAVILYALAQNGCGRLYSVDLPEFTNPALNATPFWEGKAGAAVPSTDRVGWLVEPPLDERWTLTLGRSQDVLQPLLDRLGPIDLFIHDSEHSYDNQMLEFTAGFAALRAGGLLVATDITWSDAYKHFWAKTSRSGARAAYVDASCVVVEKHR
jgi:predicted O-methyltransferase YrrM